MNKTMRLTTDDLKGAMIDLARKRFYYYCRFRLPSVYTKDRPHLERLCDDLQAFIESETEHRLILNMPPRHGKTVTVELLTEWVMGERPEIGAMVACYNETLASRFSKAVRGGIGERPSPGGRPVFSDYFPGVRIKEGDGAMQLWALEGSHFSFLATSPGGTMTGIGAQLLIVDDLIKNAEEANNERILDEHWEWYTNTVLSRLESGAKQIVIQTRWATKDLTGRLLAHEPSRWRTIIMPAQNESGKMLCEAILSRAEFEDRKTKTDPQIIAGNYQQQPFDEVDKLYAEFVEYHPDQVPMEWQRVEAYADTADQGGDSFAGVIYGLHGGLAYVLDVVFSTAGMERTEIEFARALNATLPRVCWIESNNGGAGFARNVEKRLREAGNIKTQVKHFHQGANKEARILTNAFSVTNVIRMPAGWKERWPMFARELASMGRSERWKHDDAADALTGVIEKSFGKQVVVL